MSEKLIALEEKILELTSQYAEEKLKSKKFQPGITYIPPSGKLLGVEEIQNMVQASLDAWLTT